MDKSAPSPRTRRSGIAGFSLVELAVSMTVLLILTAIAIPSLMRSIRTYQLNDAASRFAGMLKFTRFEAVRRNKQVCFRMQQNGTTWTLGTDSNCSGTLDANGKRQVIAGFATLLPRLPILASPPKPCGRSPGRPKYLFRLFGPFLPRGLLPLCGHEQHFAPSTSCFRLLDGDANLVEGEGECGGGTQNALAYESNDFAKQVPSSCIVEPLEPIAEPVNFQDTVASQNEAWIGPNADRLARQGAIDQHVAIVAERLIHLGARITGHWINGVLDTLRTDNPANLLVNWSLRGGNDGIGSQLF